MTNSTVLNSQPTSKSAQTPLGWRDSPHHFGRISRALHWLTAALVLFQFIVVLAWRAMGENTLTIFLSSIGPHGSLGFLILLVTLARLGWALSNRKHRPLPPPGSSGQIARIVHITLYGLLLWLPAFGLLRQYGRGGALQFYGLELLPEAERNITWMMAPAGLLHSPLSWLLLGLIISHIVIALVHRLWFRDPISARLMG
ncbi:cytochrome b [Vreelandella sp. V005]|uniref:cytochrome b n=1 Tax=Vreelandella sp. V005 TaxID=3459608 RepID=UPI0040440E94